MAQQFDSSVNLIMAQLFQIATVFCPQSDLHTMQLVFYSARALLEAKSVRCLRSLEGTLKFPLHL